MAYLNPKDILTDFLRYRLTDPRARAEGTNTESYTATAGQTEFSLTPSSGRVSCITSVEVNSTAQDKWQDYYIDLKDEKVVFFSGLTVGDNVDISYKYGTTNWIYPDKPRKDLSATSFPRVNILTVAGTARRMGQYNSDVEGSIQFQIDVWAKEAQDGQTFMINSKTYTGVDLADYIVWQITKAFEDHIDDIHPVLYNYNPIGMPNDLPFNEEYQAHHKVFELELNGINVGRIN